MMNLIQNHRLTLLGIALGAIAGFTYWYFVGCTSGTCMITSKWANSTAYGALLGFTLTYGNHRKEKSNP